MSGYKLGKYTFKTETEYNNAKEDLAFINAVNAKYDIHSEKTRRIILDKYKPKSIIGRDFTIKLQELDKKSSLDGLFDEIDAELETEGKIKTTNHDTNNSNTKPNGSCFIYLITGLTVFGILAILFFLKLNNYGSNEGNSVNNSNSVADYSSDNYTIPVDPEPGKEIEYYTQLINETLPASGGWIYKNSYLDVGCVGYFDIPVGENLDYLVQLVLEDKLDETEIIIQKYDYVSENDPVGEASLYVTADGKVGLSYRIYYDSTGEEKVEEFIRIL